MIMQISINSKIKAIWRLDTVKIKKTQPQVNFPGSHKKDLKTTPT